MRGVVTTNSYDGSGALTNLSYSDSTPWVALSYDRLGRTVNAGSGTNATAYIFNRAGLVISESFTGVLNTGSVHTNVYDSL